jgi:hypothetical protein
MVKDGVSSTIRTEVTQGGYNVYITVGAETKMYLLLMVLMVLTERQVLEQTVKMALLQQVRTEDIVGGYVLIIKVGDKETHNNSYGTNKVLTNKWYQWS